MNSIQIKPALSRRDLKTFLLFPWKIYRNDPLWVPPLLPERAKTIDPEQGAFFKHGYAEFFIAWMDGRPAGTFCAAEDQAANQALGTKECVFGFFECIQEYRVAEAMLKYIVQWADRHGLDALHGPFNLDYEDSYGVLIEGRDRPPALLCGHTPPYYQDYLERFGFQPARGDNIAYAIPVENSPTLERVSRLAQRVRARTQFTIREADLDHWDEEIRRVNVLLNSALAHLPDHIPWRPEALSAMLEPFRQIVDPELVLFAEHEGQTIGWFPGIPNLNEAFIHANGLRYPWDFLNLWWHMRKQPESLAIKSVLVLPQYWDTGVSVLLFDEMAKRALAKGYRWADLSLTSEDNPDTPILAKHAGAKIYKRYRVYRLRI